MDNIIFKPIGFVRSPHKEPKGVPIQPTAAKDITGTIEILEEFAPGLKDLDGFSHIIVLFNFHLSTDYKLVVLPFMDDTPRGVFSTRAPRRPNQIGISTVRLLKVEGNIIHIQGVDMVDGTPILDIKPCVPKLDQPEVERIGWLEKRVQKAEDTKADERFVE